MLNVRRAEDRGVADFGWLKSKHSFSFGHYYDPKFMGFGPLRVINEDRVQPGRGFDTHGHRDMEIISYVIDGALEHKDSMGTGSVIKPGDVQRMTAGTGVRHSEYNPSRSEQVHFLQIWIIPNQSGLEPGYEQKSFDEEQKRGQLLLVGSADGRDGSLTIHQDVNLFASVLQAGSAISYTPESGRLVWIQLIRGSTLVNGERLEAGDAIAVAEESLIEISAVSEIEFLLFDMVP